VHEPEPLVSGLAGRRVSGALVSRFSAMLAELRQMDDLAGGGSVDRHIHSLAYRIAGNPFSVIFQGRRAGMTSRLDVAGSAGLPRGAVRLAGGGEPTPAALHPAPRPVARPGSGCRP